jgi:hypothetical protein
VNGYSQPAAPSQPPHDYGAQPSYAQQPPPFPQQPAPYQQQPAPYQQPPPPYARPPAAYTPQPAYAQSRPQDAPQPHALPPVPGQPHPHSQSQPWSDAPLHPRGTSQPPGGAARRPQPHELPATTQSHRWQSSQDAPRDQGRPALPHGGRTDGAANGFAGAGWGGAGQPPAHAYVGQQDSIYSFAGNTLNNAATHRQPAAAHAGHGLPPSVSRESGQAVAQHRQQEHEQQQHRRSPYPQEQERIPQQQAPVGQASERRRDAAHQESWCERPDPAEPAPSWRPGAYPHGAPAGSQPPGGDSDTEEEEDAVPGTPPNEQRHGCNNGGNGSRRAEHDASSPSSKRPCIASGCAFG